MGRTKRVRCLERYEVHELRDEPITLGSLTSDQASVLAAALDKRAHRVPVLHRGANLADELLLVDRARAALSLGLRSPGPDVPLGTQGLLLVHTMMIATEVHFDPEPDMDPSEVDAFRGILKCLHEGLTAAGYEFA